MLLMIAATLAAQNIDPPTPPRGAASYADLMRARVPVTAGDITDRPYRIVAHVRRDVRKATLFSKGASLDKMDDELWERGRKVKADAVINARYGDERVTTHSWGARAVEGDAVRFLTDAEIAARANPQP